MRRINQDLYVKTTFNFELHLEVVLVIWIDLLELKQIETRGMYRLMD